MALTGSQVVSKHKAAIASCAGKTGWARLECIVDAMHREYEGEIPTRKWYVPRE